MTPVIPCSIGNIHLFPITAFTLRKEGRLPKYNLPGAIKPRFPSQFLLTQSNSLRLFPKYRSGSIVQHQPRIQILAATGTDVAVEEPNSAVEGEDADKTPEVSPSTSETSEVSSTGDAGGTPAAIGTAAQSKRPRAARKSEMPPVKNEQLVPGASFTGKVRSVQPFGAFVDFGAFTDGLVHVSRMSDSFVKDVNDIVSVGQEVKVRLVEANTETGRISLTMRESDDVSKLQQWKESSSSGSSDKPRPARRNAAKPNQKREEPKSTKFVKGQVLNGTVKNLTRAGAFISLPEGEEGFLPTSEESEGFGSVMGSSSLQAGQEVNVRVLRISRGGVTLTMKKEEDVDQLNSKLNRGVVHVATNPFVLAFRQNKDIASFLEEREKLQTTAETSSASTTLEVVEGKVDQTETKPDSLEVVDLPASSDSSQIDVSSASDEIVEGDKTISEEVNDKVEVTTVMAVETAVSDSLDNAGVAVETTKEEDEVKEEVTVSQADDTSVTVEKLSSSAVNETKEEAPIADGAEEDGKVTEAPIETGDKTSTSESALSEEVAVNQVSDTLVDDEVETDASAPSSVSNEESEAAPSVPKEDGSPTSNGKAVVPPPQEGARKAATVSPVLVKQLREETGAGMMDCKKALAETGGDIVKAQEFLRKKGLASAEKKANRVTAEGRIGSYVHDNRIGVLIEVNCETDFVSRGDIFKQLVDDLAMQVAACPQVKYLVTEDVPGEVVNKEREIELQKEDLLSKPEQIRSKIVEGRIRKRLEEFALLEQPYIKNDKMVVKDFVKQTISTIGENIKVKRFARYNLGEGLEKKNQDFAAEVAAQTASKPTTAAPKDEPAFEAKETIEKPAAAAVSATLVKQLREETGAGMMDCKKALSETGGDLNKAQEYLRKKGLSSADKKSSRLAAEGRIGSYIHDSRIGVLIEVNCETDFVGRSEKFKEFVDDLAMQVVACPQVQFVSVEEIPDNIISKERELEMQREDLQSKPENIRAKIVDGRISKRLGELALLEQPFVKDDSVLVKDLVKQTIAALGENIRVRRFIRFTLGETTDEVKTETEA